MNSLGHLLLPHYLPRLVIAQVSDPSPVFLVLFTPNQRVKNNISSGASGLGRLRHLGGGIMKAGAVVGAPRDRLRLALRSLL